MPSEYINTKEAVELLAKYGVMVTLPTLRNWIKNNWVNNFPGMVIQPGGRYGKILINKTMLRNMFDAKNKRNAQRS